MAKSPREGGGKGRHLTSYSFVVLIFALLNSEIMAGRSRGRRRSRIQYSDCGTQDKIIHFHHLHATPVIIPGTLYVSISGNVTDDLPRRVNLYLNIKKYFFNIPVFIPCLGDGIGSCAYENICSTLEQFETTGCPPPLRHQGIPCTCPFRAGEFSISDVAVNLPRIEGYASSLINGNYELEMIVQEEDGPELGCLRVHFSIRKKRRKRI